MGGTHITSHGTGDDGFDEDGYDESQRAEILEATRSGPSDGTVIVDLDPDMGFDDVDDAAEDDLQMSNDDEPADEADDALDDGDLDDDPDSDEIDEDELDKDDAQEDFDDGVEDDDIDDAEDAALRP